MATTQSLVKDENSHQSYFDMRKQIIPYFCNLNDEKKLEAIKLLEAELGGKDILRLLVPDQYIANLLAVLNAHYISASNGVSLANLIENLDSYLLPQQGSLQSKARKLLLGFIATQLRENDATLNGAYLILGDMFNTSESDVKRGYKEYIESDLHRNDHAFQYHLLLISFCMLECARENWRLSELELSSEPSSNKREKLKKAYGAYDKWRMNTMISNRDEAREMLLSDEPLVAKFMRPEFVDLLNTKQADFTNEEIIAILMLRIFQIEDDSPINLRSAFSLDEPVSKSLA